MEETLPTEASSSNREGMQTTPTGGDTGKMADAIWSAASMLQSSARPEMNYWHDVKQIVEMMELYKPTRRDAQETRNLRRQVIHLCHTKTDDQGRHIFLIQGINKAARRRQDGTTEWVIMPGENQAARLAERWTPQDRGADDLFF